MLGAAAQEPMQQVEQDGKAEQRPDDGDQPLQEPADGMNETNHPAR